MYTQSQLVDALSRFGGGCPVLVNGQPIIEVTIADAPGESGATTAVNLVCSLEPAAESLQPPTPDPTE